jgi:hypothetical protein
MFVFICERALLHIYYSFYSLERVVQHILDYRRLYFDARLLWGVRSDIGVCDQILRDFEVLAFEDLA